jgi:hypothetical protein
MTYKLHLEQLLTASIEASNDHISAIKVEGEADQSKVAKTQARWEESENDYSTFLNHIKTNQIDINVEMPDTLQWR